MSVILLIIYGASILYINSVQPRTAARTARHTPLADVWHVQTKNRGQGRGCVFYRGKFVLSHTAVAYAAYTLHPAPPSLAIEEGSGLSVSPTDTSFYAVNSVLIKFVAGDTNTRVTL